MLHLVCVVALVLLGVSAASAQDRGALAIDEAAGRYALSLDGEADAVNMCGTTGCKVVATFSSCLGVAHSSPTQGQAVWTWFEADTAVVARQEAFDECQRAGGRAGVRGSQRHLSHGFWEAREGSERGGPIASRPHRARRYVESGE